MTYFGFLAVFLVIPIILLALLLHYSKLARTSIAIPLVIAVHVIIAVLWTTPWDNYLVATNVWWYDINKVTGITLGYVPIEEYTFFVLQPIMSGLWIITLITHLPQSKTVFSPSPRTRSAAVAITGILWLASIVMLISGFRPGTYLGLELVWALPPLALQLAFGADILRHHWRPVLAAVASTTLYLSLADTLAIYGGIWTIDPEQTLGIYIGGILPLEELTFFLLTNMLVVFGITLATVPESRTRAQGWLSHLPTPMRRTSP